MWTLVRACQCYWNVAQTCEMCMHPPLRGVCTLARRGGRAPRPSDDHRKANRRKNSEERGASSGVRTRTPREGALSDDAV